MSRDRVLALLAQTQESTQGYEANQGLGSLGWVPNEGEHQSILLGIDLSEGKFTYGGKNNSAKADVPAAVIQFQYQLVDDPDSPDGKPRSYKGRPFVIPAVPMANLPEGGPQGKQQTRVRIEKERLMGHIKTLLGTEPPDWQTGISACLQKVDEAAARSTCITVGVKWVWRDQTDKAGKPNGKRVPDSEYLTQLIAG